MTETGNTERVERRATNRSLAERVLVVAPTGDDAAVASQILRDAGSDVLVLDDLTALAAEVKAGAGVVLIASEALADESGCTNLREALERQEPWSEIPILLIGGGPNTHDGHQAELLGDSAHVVLLERPLGMAAFLTAVEAALRSRRRQFEVRRLLNELAESAVAIKRAHEEANHAKDEFLATLAHELRSPMTAIRGWVQLLKDGDLPPSDAADALAMIESSAKVQARIVEDLMDMSRILAGKIMFEPVRVELGPLLTSVLAAFHPDAAGQGIELTAELPAEPVLLHADEVRIRQIGSNLLSNAIKFTPSGGSVRVVLTVENDRAVLRVRDTGQGIPPELLPHVFERYRQVDGESSKQHRGLGLGLSIVKHLVELHGGTIVARSEGLGKGAELVVTLPLEAAPAR
jgi:two-component system, sensor histidine kinase